MQQSRATQPFLWATRFLKRKSSLDLPVGLPNASTMLPCGPRVLIRALYVQRLRVTPLRFHQDGKASISGTERRCAANMFRTVVTETTFGVDPASEVACMRSRIPHASTMLPYGPRGVIENRPLRTFYQNKESVVE